VFYCIGSCFIPNIGRKLFHYCHRCTVVGNPRRGPWVFLVNSFEGGTWGCEKIRGEGGRVLLHFYVEVFQKSL
jgi:hypothetical protein